MTGTLAAGDVTYVEAFLDAAAVGLKAFIDNRRSYDGMTAKQLIKILEDLGYDLTDHDREWCDNFESNLLETFSLTVTIQKCYMSDVTETPFAQVIIFGNEEQAAKYYYIETRNVSQKYKVYTGNIYFVTDDYDTIKATFPSDSNQPLAS